MSRLIPIQYHNKKYPDSIKPKIREVAAHFDIENPTVEGRISLHTEYSFMPRKLNNARILNYPLLCQNKKGIPQLWYDDNWSKNFAEYIVDICGNIHPEIIEIHPPFSDYCDIASFLKCYSIFEEIIIKKYPDTIILIENRCGTRYSGGKFIVSKIDEIIELSKHLDNSELQLKITLDIPQLFTAHALSSKTIDIMDNLFMQIKAIRHNIQGIHLWGKKLSSSGRRVAHVGDLDSYFNYNVEHKQKFLKLMQYAFDDDVARYFVPEVNSGNEDLRRIAQDLLDYNFHFTT